MKINFIVYIIFICTSCSSLSRNNNTNRLDILQVDSIDIYYVFNTTHSINTIIIGEKEILRPCLPFPNYIITDSIKTTSILKEGNRKILIGADGYTIDNIRIKNMGEPVKYIDNCESFSD